jgi:tripartite-type tricarboxylate transporter receptor subunit TctC
MSEAGMPGFDVVSWIGALVPVGTPQPIVQKIHDDLVDVLHMPDIQKQLGALGAEVVGDTPQEFDAWNRKEIAKWAKAVKESGARVD